MKKKIFKLLLLVIFSFFSTLQSKEQSMGVSEGKTVGIFKTSDPRLEGVKWGNWGSRPYEYEWISSILNVKDKKIIDLGCGLPSQYDWFQYVINSLNPAYYVGIDADARIINEQIENPSYTIGYMNMNQLRYPNKSFDVAYCISTFEHIEYDTFMKCIKEAHRVLNPEGLLLITLDESWDKNMPITSENGWNTLEQSLIQKKLFNSNRSSIGFSLPNFLKLVEKYFVLFEDDAALDIDNQTIYSKSNPSNFYYKRVNRDENILFSPIVYNSCVSYAVLKKKK